MPTIRASSTTGAPPMPFRRRRPRASLAGMSGWTVTTVPVIASATVPSAARTSDRVAVAMVMTIASTREGGAGDGGSEGPTDPFVAGPSPRLPASPDAKDGVGARTAPPAVRAPTEEEADMFEKILLAVDGSEHATKAVAMAAD